MSKYFIVEEGKKKCVPWNEKKKSFDVIGNERAFFITYNISINTKGNSLMLFFL